MIPRKNSGICHDLDNYSIIIITMTSATNTTTIIIYNNFNLFTMICCGRRKIKKVTLGLKNLQCANSHCSLYLIDSHSLK